MIPCILSRITWKVWFRLHRYVVDEKHKSYLEIPFIEKYTRIFNVSAFEAFNHFLKSKGHNIDEFWKNVDDAIITLTVDKVKFIEKYVENFKETHQDKAPKTFELIRCDFILDENFNLFLMEVRNIWTRKISHWTRLHQLADEHVTQFDTNEKNLRATRRNVRENHIWDGESTWDNVEGSHNEVHSVGIIWWLHSKFN